VSGTVDAKPSNFIVSLVYLLGVVLPGSIVTFLAITGPLRYHLPNAVAAVRSDSGEAWVIFAITSYRSLPSGNLVGLARPGLAR
jgi:hypothetical protein